MATRETDPSVFTAPESASQISLTFDDNRLASTLFGQYGQNLALVERRLGVVANSLGNTVTNQGSGAGDLVQRAANVSESDIRGNNARGIAVSKAVDPAAQ